MSKEKKEEKKEEKSPELVAAEKKVEEEKKMNEELLEALKKHNCTVEGMIEVHEEKVKTHVVFVPFAQAGEKEEERQKRAEAARDEVDKKLKDLGHELLCSGSVSSNGPKFNFRFAKLEEEKKD